MLNTPERRMPDRENVLATLRAQAVNLHMQGALARAEPLYQEILERWPDDHESLVMFGVLAAQTQRPHRAVELLRQAIRVNEASPKAHNNLGIVLTNLQQHGEAVASFDAAISLSPSYAAAYANRGVALGHLKRFDDALASYDRAVGLQPNAPSAYLAHLSRGGLLRQMGRRHDAFQSYECAVALQPENPQAHISKADLLRDMDRLDEALRSAEQAVRLQPLMPEALVARGAVLQELRRPLEALDSYDRAIAVRPDHAPALGDRAAVLCALSLPQEALVSSDRSLALDPHSPAAHVNRGVALQDLGRYEDALEAYDRAIALDPRNSAVYNNRGTILQQLERFDEALASYDQSMALEPKSADPSFFKGLCLLLLEEFQEGWRLYESRERGVRSLPMRGLRLRQPRWQGRDTLQGKTLFTSWEQGLGDTIQFCRYAKLAEERGAHVVLEVQTALSPLMRSLSPTLDVVVDLDSAAGADYQCPLLSLPAAFGTRPETIPNSVPYLFAEPERVVRWRQRLGSDGFRIGICWQGGAGKVDAGRSFPLAMFRCLSDMAGVRLISLQKNFGTEQIRAVPAGLQIEVLGDDFDAGGAFLDTAAVMESLDLIITSDTAIAHLAGALARPAWVALKHVPDWRWALKRTDSPWYPTHRLFRQARPGDWGRVFEDIRSELLQRCARRDLG
jgi:tetratricopeptide (TPR) repeat protein